MNKTNLLKHILLSCTPIIILVILGYTAAYGQTEASISIDTCLRLAKEYYPLAKQKGYLKEISDNSSKGINTKWYPQVNLASSATYQSEVTSFDFPGFLAMYLPKDNYSVGLQVNQTVYDFGESSQLKKTEKAGTDTEIQKNEIELYKLNDRILQIYGNILLTKENIKILESYIDDIKNRQANMASSVNNGVLLQSNLDVLDAEMLKTSQKLVETNYNLTILYQTLSLLINRQINENTEFLGIPTATASAVPVTILRPELQFFESQQRYIDEKIVLVNRKSMPHLSVFIDGAYGRPGYNFLDTKMRLYAIAGANLTWNISSIQTNSFEKKNLFINKNIVDEQKDLFQLNLKTTLAQQNGEIDKIEKMIELDKSIVDKRILISETAANQLENGIITSTDYLTLLSAEKQAVLNQHVHEIQLGIAIKNYNITTGTK